VIRKCSRRDFVVLSLYYCRGDCQILLISECRIGHTIQGKGENLYSLLTHAMQHSRSREANWFSASQEIPHILWNRKVHYCIHKCLPPLPILRYSPGLKLTVWMLCNKILQSWRTTPSRLSAAANIIYSQLPSILEAVPPTTT
jgi:hypothetical protein